MEHAPLSPQPSSRRAEPSAAPTGPRADHLARATPASAPTPQISGRDESGTLVALVFDPASGAPIPHAALELTRFSQDSAAGAPPATSLHHADAEGRLVLPLPASDLRLVAWSETLIGTPTAATITPGGTTHVELALSPGVEIAGIVRDALTRAPIPDAEVRIWTFAESDRVTTNAEGVFRHPRFPRTGVAEQVQVRAPGYGATVRYLGVDASGRWEVPDPVVEGRAHGGTGTPWLELELPPATTIRGLVLDANDEPIADAHVSAEGYYRTLPDLASLDGAATETDAEGRFELRGLRSDISHGLSIRARGCAEAHLEVAADQPGVVVLEPTRLQSEVSLAGVVVDAEGVPVQDIRVVLRPRAAARARRALPPEPADLREVGFRTWDDEREVRTNSDGVFQFEGVEVGAWSLAVTRDQDDLVTRDVDPGELGPDAFLELQLGADALTLRGTIAGVAPATARVHVARRGPSGVAEPVAWVLPDLEGRFRVSGLDAFAPYELTVVGTSLATGAPVELHGSAYAYDEVHLKVPLGAPGANALADLRTR